jgi:hypothetical protein
MADLIIESPLDAGTERARKTLDQAIAWAIGDTHREGSIPTPRRTARWRALAPQP